MWLNLYELDSQMTKVQNITAAALLFFGLSLAGGEADTWQAMAASSALGLVLFAVGMLMAKGDKDAD